MELASGYSDSINYGNGYTPLANNAIANNNSDYARNQAAIALMAQQAQNNVFASGGGFGQQTADYAGAGAAYGRATGGFNAQPAQTPDNIAEYYRLMSGGYGQPGGYTPQQPAYDDSAGLNPSTAPNGGAQPQPQLPWFWQGVRDATGMGQPGGSGYDPYAGLGNQGQQGVIDPFGYGSGGYQGNAIPDPIRAPVQGGPDIGSFWQGIRDLAGADPKYQGRAPYDGGSGGGGIGSDAVGAPNQPDLVAEYYRLMGGGGSQPNPYYWSGNFFGANNGSGIGQGEGMAPGMGGFNNPAVPTSPQQWYGAGGYNPYDPQTYGGSALQNLGTGQPNVSTPGVFGTGTSPWTPSYLSGGGLNPNDPGNIAEYYRLMGGGGGGATDFSSQSRSGGLEGTNYNTFQGGSPQWANSIPGNDPNMQNAIYRAAGNTGLYPSALAGVMYEESGWNPSSAMKGNYGVPQMSANMWGDSPFNGQMAGQNFQQFRDGSGPNQIDAYADWLNRSGNLYKGGIDVPAQSDPVMQAALLQGIQFGGNAMNWRNALAGGNMNVPVTTSPQAQNLGTTSIDDMYNAYSNMMTPQWTGQSGS
jgi:hypothetical protein